MYSYQVTMLFTLPLNHISRLQVKSLCFVSHKFTWNRTTRFFRESEVCSDSASNFTASFEDSIRVGTCDFHYSSRVYRELCCCFYRIGPLCLQSSTNWCCGSVQLVRVTRKIKFNCRNIVRTVLGHIHNYHGSNQIISLNFNFRVVPMLELEDIFSRNGTEYSA